MVEKKQNLVVVSNRLPVILERRGEDWGFRPGSGGLVSALSPVLQNRGGTWIGWPGTGEEAPCERIFENSRAQLGYRIVPVPLSPEEVDSYYHGFSNETLWPLFHSMLGRTVFNHAYWDAYRRVNARFAAAAVSGSGNDDLIWIQDYQLLLAGSAFREKRPRARIGFFLHIPFPSPDIFIRLPWREEIIRGMLSYSLLGFQTRKDLRNFIHCVRNLVPECEIGYRAPVSILRYEGRTALAGAFPIGIDYGHYDGLARSPEVERGAWFLHEKFPERRLLLGIDRLDYTKGIPNRFEAFARCLEKYPELREKISLIQVVVPSRMEVPEYQAMKRELDELVGRINGRFTVLGWVPIHYVFGTLEPAELASYYRSCDIALITPLNDGMNLVAKEYCASCVQNRGILILSEFAGAADQLGRGALLTNPYDIERTADTIRLAYGLEKYEREKRMRWLRNQVRRHDVHRWVRSFLETAGEVPAGTP